MVQGRALPEERGNQRDIESKHLQLKENFEFCKSSNGTLEPRENAFLNAQSGSLKITAIINTVYEAVGK